MIKIHYNELTGRVIGTEIVDDNSDTRDCVDDISDFVEHNGNGMYNRLKDNLYFIDGKLKILDNHEPDYYDKSKELIDKIRDLEKSYKDNILLEKLTAGVSLEQALFEIQEVKNQLDMLKLELNKLHENHYQELKEYRAAEGNKRLEELNPEKYSAICLLIRDENQYLAEWIDHYLNLGVDLICIYDNGIKESVTDIIATLEDWKQEKIEVIPYHDSETPRLQEDVNNDFINRYKDKVRWVAFIDSDEFIELETQQPINDFLKQYEEYGSIFMNWVMYTANGQEIQTEGFVQERFIQEFPEPKNHRYRYFGKEFMQIYKVDKIIRYHAKFLWKNKMYVDKDTLNLDKIKLKHYYTKSLEEWKNKIDRGSCDCAFKKSYQEFFKLNPDMEYLNSGEDYRQEYGPYLEKKSK